MNNVGIKTYWTATVRDEHGQVKQTTGPWPNMLTKDGVDAMHLAILSPTSRPAVFQYIAIGTNNGAESRAHTALLAEVHRQVADTTTHVPDTILTTLRTTFGPGDGSGSIQECGLFNAASGGTLLARALIGLVTKGPLDTLDIEVQFKQDEVIGL